MLRYTTALLTTVILTTTACNLDIPLNPASLGRPVTNFFNDLEESADRAVADPFEVRPFPRLIGGNNRDVFYATNLADVRIDFAGPTNDLILPGIPGPSNLYAYDTQNRERDLINPFIPTGVFFTPFANLATDGEFVAYAITSDTGIRIEAGRVGQSADIVFQSTEDGQRVSSLDLALDDGQLAFQIFDAETDTFAIRVIDLLRDNDARDIPTEGTVRLDLRDDLLAFFVETESRTTRIELFDLVTGESTIIADDVRLDLRLENNIYITDNLVVWDEATASGLNRISAYDIPTDTSFVWADGVAGRLAGATDDFFIMEETEFRLPRNPDRIFVRRFDAEGQMRTLARFPREGLAGQTAVVGQFVAWVNPERQVILAPIAGGDRLSFKPF